MITSIFNKSKPINFIIVLFITILAFVTAKKNVFTTPVTTSFILNQIGAFLACIANILVFNFIISKNSLTKNNAYGILLFSLFLLAFAQTTSHLSILLANLFVLLGLRRIISLHTQKNIKSKLFDAAFFIAIATLFYFWAILFGLVIILSLIFHSGNNIRHWVIPLVGMATVWVISVGASVIIYNHFFQLFKSTRTINFDYTAYNSAAYLIAITMLLSFGLWASIFYLQIIKKKKKALRTSFKIIIITTVIAFILILLAPEKNGNEFLFLFAPLAIIITNYIEVISDKWFKEIFVAILVLIPFLLCML